MIHEIFSEEELPDLPLLKIHILSLWGAQHYLDVNGYEEGWFRNVNYGEKWLYIVDAVREAGDTHRRIK